MLRDYRDIRERLGEPIWFDDQGVPRYVDFYPDACGVYDNYVCFMEVACQLCGVRFKVASTWQHYRRGSEVLLLPSVEHGCGSFHYGDPPIHHCTGDTMNVECVCVLEFWRKDYAISWEWERLPVHEVLINEHARNAASEATS